MLTIKLRIVFSSGISEAVEVRFYWILLDNSKIENLLLYSATAMGISFAKLTEIQILESEHQLQGRIDGF